MAGDSKFYDPNAHVMTFGGVPLQGFSEDTKVKVERISPRMGSMAGVDGEVTRYRLNDPRVKITISLMQSSSSNDDLSEAHDIDFRTPGGVVSSFYLQDLLGSTVISCGAAWIVGYPDEELKKTPGPREWVIEGVVTTQFMGGN